MWRPTYTSQRRWRHEPAVAGPDALPIARSAVLVGRTLSDLARNVGIVTLLLGVGLLVGFSPNQSILRLVAAIALLLAFAYVF